MSKLVVDIDKILAKLKNYSTEANDFKKSVNHFKNAKVNCSINEIENNINDYIDKVGIKLSNISNKAIEFYEKVDQSCTEYQNNEEDLKSIQSLEKPLNNVDNIIFNDKAITTGYHGIANEKLSSFASTKIVPSMSKARLFIMQDGRAEVSDSELINKAIEWALKTADDNTYGYSLDMNERWGTPSFDCSTFVMSAYCAAGINVLTGGKKENTNYCGSMIDSFTATGKFEWIPGQPKKEDLKPGDILLNPNSHTEMYIGNGLNAGAHSNKDGRQGDSGGNEVSVGAATYDNYGRGWTGVLRYKGDE